MKATIALIAFLVGLWSQSQAVACTLKLSEFRTHLKSIEQESKQFEQMVLNADSEVKKQAGDFWTGPYRTDSTPALTTQITQTEQKVIGLNDRLVGFAQESDNLFTCVLALRQRGGAALKKATKANDTTRILRVQQALKELTDLDLKAIDLSIRIAIMVSKTTRMLEEIGNILVVGSDDF